MTRVSVILPAHNNAGCLSELLRRLTSTLEPLGEFEVIMAEDVSKDNSWQVIQQLASADGRVKA